MRVAHVARAVRAGTARRSRRRRRIFENAFIGDAIARPAVRTSEFGHRDNASRLRAGWGPNCLR